MPVWSSSMVLYSCPNNYLKCDNFTGICLYCCSFTQLCLTLCNPVICSMPGLAVLHHVSELTQSHVHWVSDAIQPSHPVLSPSPPVFNLSQHQGLFQWVGSSYQVANALQLQLQHQSFQWIFNSFRIDWFDLLAVQETLKSLLQHHQFFSTLPSLWLNTYIHTWILEKPWCDCMDLCP